MPDREKSSIQKIQDLLSTHAPDMKRDLSYILQQANPERSYEQKLEWLALLQAWIVAPVNEQRSPHTRIRFILQLLERHPDWARNVSLVLKDLIRTCRSFAVFAYLGLFEEKGFIDQSLGLAIESILPLPKPPQDLAEILEQTFPDREDALWIEQLPPALVREIVTLIEVHSRPEDLSVSEAFQNRIFDRILDDMLSAMRVLAVQISSAGSTRSLWMRLGSPNLDQLPFWRLEQKISKLCYLLQKQPPEPWEAINLAEIFEELRACEHAMNRAFDYLQTNGVNTGLVLRMEHILMHMKRLELCLKQLDAIKEGRGPEFGHKFLAELIRARYDAQNFSQLLKGNMQMLSLRVVEHTGSSGEHYITRSRAEYFSMLRSASGGGVLTVGTTAIKYGISKLAAPPFVEAIFNASNFAASFLIMQGLHFTLATKQPSMTAAALANKIRQSKGQKNNLAIALEIRHIVRSQFAAVLGNLGLAVPTALLLSYGYAQIQGTPFFEADYAKSSIESLHPIRTLSLLYAAETGVLLWVSSLVAGWMENWIAYQKVPDRLTRNARIKRAFGPEAGARIAGFIQRNISGITGNVVLGFLLAMVPFLGKVSGLPLDVRHVTLSSAGLAISAVSLGDKVVPFEVFMASAGTIAIGLLNFGVSFYLALSVARYAQNLNERMFLSIWKRVTQLFTWAPMAFFYPTRGAEESEGDTIPLDSQS